MKKNDSNYNIIYDRDDEVLSVELKKAKSVDSDINGNAVIDYDKNGGIIRINLYNFSFNNFKEKMHILKEFSRVSCGDFSIK